MRPLTEDEMKTLFEKLTKFLVQNVRMLLERPDEDFCFRLHNDRVYYMSHNQLKMSACIPRDNLACVGTCFGKFTKTGKFRLHITALDHMARFAPYKVWLKPSAEQSYLYGNHVLKAGLARITEDTPQYQGVVVYNMSEVPLGFGVVAYSTAQCRRLEPTAIAAFHQADIGEYLRGEAELC